MAAAVASLPHSAAAAAAAAAPAAATPAPSSTDSSSSSTVTHSRALQSALSSLPALSARLTERFVSNAAKARRLFLGQYAQQQQQQAAVAGSIEETSATIKLQAKIAAEYGAVAAGVHAAAAKGATATPSSSGVGTSSTALQRPARVVREEATGVLTMVSVEDAEDDERTALAQPKSIEQIVNALPAKQQQAASASASAAAGSSTALVAFQAAAAGGSMGAAGSQALVAAGNQSARQLLIASKREIDDVRPEWHAPWKLMRVISAHSGWVRAIAVDHSNEWFATGSVDRTIKIFDLASGALKLTLTGHISAIRGICISKLMPYMFSIGEDKQLKCWDLTENKVIRNYHGHLSGGYCVNLLESQAGPNVLVSGGRDSAARVWDIRTTAEVAVLAGHTQTVASIQCQMLLPQVITGSHDQTIKLWDLRKTSAPLSTLTNHKKSVRALQLHPTEYTFTSGAGDNLKVWKMPEGTFLRNLSGHNATINALAINRDNVLVSGADNGSLHFWDYKSGHAFQTHQTVPQPGSLDAESGIFAMSFDQTGSRLLTAETDKSIKVYKEDENATEETHPLNWRPGKRRKRF